MNGNSNLVTEVDTITRHVVVNNRFLSQRQALEKTGCRWYLTGDILFPASQYHDPEVDLVFFPPGLICPNDLPGAYERRIFRPADVHEIAAANEDTELANVYPNRTYWQDPGGNWWHASFFRRWYSQRLMQASCYGSNITNEHWLAAVRICS